MEIFGNFSKYIEYLPIAIIGFVLTLILTPVVGAIATKLQILDRPPSEDFKNDPERHRRLEKAPRPIMGGVAVILPFLLLSLIYVELIPKVIGILIGVSILLVLGIFDDIKRLSWSTQILVQFFVVAVIIISGFGLTVINNPFDGVLEINFLEIPINIGTYIFHIQILGDIILTFWILFCMNAVKWNAGTDGLMEGNIAISSLIFFLVSIRENDYVIATLSMILFGSVIAFLFFNFYPSKILSGSAGKSVYGFILAVLAVLSEAKLALALIVLALPVVDMLWVMSKRFVGSSDKSLKGRLKAIFKADNKHFHHELLRLGFGERQIAYIEYLITLCLGIVAFAITGSLRALVLGIAFTFVAAIVVFTTLRSRSKRTNG